MLKTILSLLCSFVLTISFAQQNTSIDMVLIEGGTFKMGCTKKQFSCENDETPVHTVQVQDFRISENEITNAQYCYFLNDIGANPGGSYYGYEYIDIGDNKCNIIYKEDTFFVEKGKENYPVIEVTWYGAKAFCHWAEGRLPSEAEWEYAARGGNAKSNFIYSGSDTLRNVGWFKHNYYTSEATAKFTYREGALPVGQKKPNSQGIYDMSGNVWEYCNDWYQEDYYQSSPKKNPHGPEYSNYRVIRGGSYKEEANKCRIAERGKALPGYSKEDIGFRLCRDVK
jgi:formylglycine-generating enzyme required for sulfatase activity